MKVLLWLLCLFVISASSISQSLSEKISSIYNQTGQNIPVDQLFLHLDRNLYHPEDTIRFQAYIRDRRTGVFKTESCALYTLLLNSHHVTIDSARFRIAYPTVSGWLKIPEATPPGDYSILAFTSNDMNYCPEFAFTAPIRIDDTIPVQNESKYQSKNEDVPLYPIPLLQPTIKLRFIPEGGTFIYGIQQRFAFHAVTSDGIGLEVAGIITNQKGTKIAGFKSTPYGQGVVEFKPLLGDSYFATLMGEEFKGLEWSFPSPEKSGVSMQVNNGGNGVIDIILQGREINGKLYLLTITMNNILVFAEEVRLDTLFRKRIHTNKLPAGIAFVTLYDHDLNPVAERPVFLNDYKKMNIAIDVLPSSVDRGDETELAIHTIDGQGNSISSTISVAVIDSISGYSNGIPCPNIEPAFLFDKEFYNNLPFEIKSGELINMDGKSVDALLMTYGGRKPTPKEVSLRSPEKELVNFDCVKICNPGPLKKGRSDIKILCIESLDIIELVTDKNREVILPFDSLDANVNQIMILPDNNPVKNINPIRIEFPANKDFTDEVKRIPFDPGYQSSVLPVVSKKPPDLVLDSIVFIEPVTVKAKKQPPGVYVDKYEKLFQSASTSTMYNKDFSSSYCFEDIIFRYILCKVDMQDKRVYLRSGYPALVVLDDSPIDTSYISIASLPASQIASITFLRGIQGFAMFGHKAIGGIVFVTTKTGSGISDETNPGQEFRRKDDLMKPVRLFREEIEYFIPTKEEVASKPELQSRSTILWKDNILVDESGIVTIKYPNNLVKGTAIVFVNGISFTNLIGSNRYSYKVK